MTLMHRCAILPLAALLGFPAIPTAAQDGAGYPAPGAAALKTSPAVLTGKERLGRKWMDEQRIDNCNVPVEKRGTKPRPATCRHVPTG